MASTTENKRSTSKKIKGVILNFFLGLSIVIVLLASAWSIFLRSDDSFLFGYKPYIIASESMEPTFMKYAVVLIKEGGYENVRDGDVIAYKAPQFSGQAALHRVMDATPDGFVTKGDANSIVDEHIVTTETFIGHEVWHTNLTAPLFVLLHKPHFNLALIIIPSLLVASFIIKAILSTKTVSKQQGLKNHEECECGDSFEN